MGPDDSDNCWICYVSYGEDKERNILSPEGNGWVAPCKCKGTSMWVLASMGGRETKRRHIPLFHVCPLHGKFFSFSLYIIMEIGIGNFDIGLEYKNKMYFIPFYIISIHT